jgi:hypothetical protein
MQIQRSFAVGRFLRRLTAGLGWAVMLCASGGCPEPGATAGSSMKPTADLSIQYHLEPGGTQLISPGQSLTLRVVVDSKGAINLGVEFEVANVAPGITASVSPSRIAETARETQLVVQASPGLRAGDYDFTLRARLTGSGPGGPDWTPALVPLRVPGTEAGFTLSCAGELAVPAGAARTLTCRTIREQGFNDFIDLSFAARPGYLMFYPETARVGPDVGGFAFTVVRSLDAQTPAFYDLVAIGRSGSLTRQSTVRLFFSGL